MRSTIRAAGRSFAGAALAAALAATAGGPARAGITGELECNIAGGDGAIVASTRRVSCTFRDDAGPDQFYSGTVSRLGLDVGPLAAGTLSYRVVAVGTAAPGALGGSYVGSGAGIALGRAGVGVDALVGGGGGAVTLQPLATSRGAGANLSAGLRTLRLRFVGLAPPRRAYRGR